jgi:ubiquinone/menaquinone biosynthesis C-methylase UbiE
MTRQDFAAAVRQMFADSAEVSFYSTLNAQGLNCIEEALVCRAFVPGQLVLDVGCGAGREAVSLAQYGIRVVAMDFVHEMVQATAAHAAAHSTAVVPLEGNVSALPFREGAFDGTALFNNVIAHVPIRAERVAALHTVWRVLRPGGTLAMITSNRRCHWKFQLYFAWVNRWRRLARRLGYDSGLEDFDRWTARISKGGWRQPAFFHMYDRDEAIADLQAAKFDVLDTIGWTGFEAAPDHSPLLGFLAQRP